MAGLHLVCAGVLLGMLAAVRGAPARVPAVSLTAVSVRDVAKVGAHGRAPARQAWRGSTSSWQALLFKTKG